MILNIVLYPHYDKDLILLFSQDSFSKLVRQSISRYLQGNFDRFIMPFLADTDMFLPTKKKSYTVALDESASAWVESIDRGYRNHVIKNLVRSYFLMYPVYIFSESQPMPTMSVQIQHGTSTSQFFTGKYLQRPKAKHNVGDQKKNSAPKDGRLKRKDVGEILEKNLPDTSDPAASTPPPPASELNTAPVQVVGQKKEGAAESRSAVDIFEFATKNGVDF